jgi:hypothetical protein
MTAAHRTKDKPMNQQNRNIRYIEAEYTYVPKKYSNVTHRILQKRQTRAQQQLVIPHNLK